MQSEGIRSWAELADCLRGQLWFNLDSMDRQEHLMECWQQYVDGLGARVFEANTVIALSSGSRHLMLGAYETACVYYGECEYTESEHLMLGVRDITPSIIFSAQAAEVRQKLLISCAVVESLQLSDPIGAFELDARGTLTKINNTLCEIVGRSGEALLGEGWTHAVHPVDQAHVISSWQTFIVEKSHLPLTINCRVVKSCDLHRPIRVITVPVVDGGEIIGYVGTLIDLTEKYFSRELELHAHQQIQSLRALGTVGLYKMDVLGRLLEVDEVVCQLAGLTSQHLLHHSWTKISYPEDRQDLIAAWTEFVTLDALHEVFIFTRRVYREDQEMCVIKVCVRAIVDEGKIAGYFGVVMDTTREAQFHDQLLLSNQRIQNLRTLNVLGLFEFDSQGELFYIDESFCQISGHERHLILDNWLHIFHPDDQQKVNQFWQRLLERQTTDSVQMDVRIITKEQQLMHVRVVAKPICSSKGDVRGYTGSLMNVTQEVSFINEHAVLMRIIDESAYMIGYADIATQRSLYVNKAFRKVFASSTGITTSHPLDELERFQTLIFPTAIQQGSCQCHRVGHCSSAITTLNGIEYAIAALRKHNRKKPPDVIKLKDEFRYLIKQCTYIGNLVHRVNGIMRGEARAIAVFCVSPLVERMMTEHARNHPGIDWSCEISPNLKGAAIRWDDILLEQMLTNLFDNASTPSRIPAIHTIGGGPLN